MTGKVRPVRLLAFTGATEWGGAEIVWACSSPISASNVQPTLLGVDAAVLTRIAAAAAGHALVAGAPRWEASEI